MHVYNLWGGGRNHFTVVCTVLRQTDGITCDKHREPHNKLLNFPCLRFIFTDFVSLLSRQKELRDVRYCVLCRWIGRYWKLKMGNPSQRHLISLYFIFYFIKVTLSLHGTAAVSKDCLSAALLGAFKDAQTRDAPQPAVLAATLISTRLMNLNFDDVRWWYPSHAVCKHCIYMLYFPLICSPCTALLCTIAHWRTRGIWLSGSVSTEPVWKGTDVTRGRQVWRKWYTKREEVNKRKNKTTNTGAETISVNSSTG